LRPQLSMVSYDFFFFFFFQQVRSLFVSPFPVDVFYPDSFLIFPPYLILLFFSQPHPYVSDSRELLCWVLPPPPSWSHRFFATLFPPGLVSKWFFPPFYVRCHFPRIPFSLVDGPFHIPPLVVHLFAVPPFFDAYPLLPR